MTTHHKSQQQTWLEKVLNLLLSAGGIIVCYSAFSVYQEKITRKSYGENDERFSYMQALVFVQCAVNTVVALVAKRSGPKSMDNVPFLMYSMCSTSYFLAMLFSNLALEWVNFPTQVLGKSCKPIPVMIFGVIFAHKRYHWKKYVCVLAMVMGMAVFLYKDKSKPRSGKADLFEFGAGEMLVVASLAMDGVTGAVQDKIRHNYTTEKWSMMFFMNFYSAAFLAITLTATGELAAFIQFVQTYTFIVQDMLMFAIAGAAGQCFIFKIVTDFGPLPCSIVTTSRKLFSLFISVLLFGHPFSTRHMIGTAIVFSALFYDALESKRAHDKTGYKPVPKEGSPVAAKDS
ncbi:UAA transporter family domain-containing protein [Ditylenchus destructor]|uniref:UAA transporter family domain-containing protein n=1 Tax=Ditylenchus destructor TaxID=166010 RepID=A0AAD4NAZ9_9BILA|nr:UAA transporter family domain-containing protein [Ditylenchus destructor]